MNELTTVVKDPTMLGVALDQGMSFEMWAVMFTEAALRWEQSNWLLADCLNHPHADTDNGHQLIATVLDHPRFARLTPGTLNNIKSIGSRYTLDERQAALSWSHYAAVAYVLDKDERAQILKEAEEKDLGVRELRERVKDGKPNLADTSVVSDDSVRASASPAPTLEDFEDARGRCAKQLRDFAPCLKDKRIGHVGLTAAARIALKSLKELIEIGEKLSNDV